MPRAVLDTTVLVSAFLNPNPGGVSFEVLRLAKDGAYALCVSDDILDEVAQTLITHERIRRRYSYPDSAIVEFCKEVSRLATVIGEVPAIEVVRDPNDDMILACAIAASADYLVTRDKDLLALGTHETIRVVTPETFLQALRLAPPST
jgi:putative PIN family toxin of toxin-antitoxin system